VQLIYSGEKKLGKLTIRIQKKTWLYKFIVLLNWLVALLLLVSVLASYINPAFAWIIALIGIAYPYILVINLLFILYWLLVFDRAILISLVVILAGYPVLRNHFQFTWSPPPPLKEANSFKFLRFNTRLFDVYGWTDRIDTRTRIFNLIKKEAPQILCIQEFYTSTSRSGFNSLDSLKALQQSPYVHVAYTATKWGTDHWGIATFSSFPIIRKGNILFNEITNNICIYSDIKINQDTIRVYNIHFQSNRFRKEDYEFLDKPDEQKDKLLASKNIINKIKTASVKRSKQVDAVANHIESSPYPVIICGDFNDPPSSYTYNRISGDLKDAFVESGSGFGNTYNGLIPLLRIDYILHSPQIRSTDFKTVKQNLSDHFPITCKMEVMPEPVIMKASF
jgi:endonuclease/exonuclease/phosphatase family metal-dependent hydrolase